MKIIRIATKYNRNNKGLVEMFPRHNISIYFKASGCSSYEQVNNMHNLIVELFLISFLFTEDYKTVLAELKEVSKMRAIGSKYSSIYRHCIVMYSIV